MAMSPKIVTPTLQSKRRTLRSNYKPLLHNNNTISPAKNDQIVNEIKTELEHQEANNLTKTSFPIQEDLKPIYELILQPQQDCLSLRNLQQQIDLSQKPHANIILQRASQINQEGLEDSLEEKLNQGNEFEKKFTRFSTPPTKSCSKPFKKTQSSSFDGIRKSYRKIKKNHTRLVPFRRCQDQLQNRIVGLINKISQNKHNEKEIQIFCDKIGKISFKDMCNPYVISGIQTVLNLYLKKSLQPHTQSFLRLKNQVKRLSSKVWQELGKIDSYEKIVHEKEQIDFEMVKPKLVRKVYKMLIQQRKCEPNMARSQSFEVCELFLTKWNQQTSQEGLIDFLREQKFLKI